MGSNLDAIVQEGYHLHETHIYSNYRKPGVKPYIEPQEQLIRTNLPNHHAYHIWEYSEHLMD